MSAPVRVAVVDLGTGNLFSILQACAQAGMEATLTQDPRELERAEGILLPGVGAFATGMETLREKRLVEPLRELAAHRPLLGICLGMQLLLERSHEFGTHEGLGLVPGEVVPFRPEGQEGGRRQKIPLIGWYPVTRPEEANWEGSLFAESPDADYFYFVHSFHAVPEDPGHILARSHFGPQPFTAALRVGGIQGVQFHPERSGPAGLALYRAFARQVAASR